MTQAANKKNYDNIIEKIKNIYKYNSEDLIFGNKQLTKAQSSLKTDNINIYYKIFLDVFEEEFKPEDATDHYKRNNQPLLPGKRKMMYQKINEAYILAIKAVKDKWESDKSAAAALSAEQHANRANALGENERLTSDSPHNKSKSHSAGKKLKSSKRSRKYRKNRKYLSKKTRKSRR